MKVYHGSYAEITHIDLTKSRSHRDFGRGFYVTRFRLHAEKWATNIARRYRKQGVVTEFEYRDNSFTQQICKKKIFDSYNEEWLDFVVLNRNEDIPEPAHDYDIVEGPVADDKVQNRIDSYLKGDITKLDFLEELTYHEDTHQICFCTLVSLQTLSRSCNDPVRKIEDISEPLIESLMLDNQIDEVKASDLFYNSETFAHLADESAGYYKKSWTEIYEMLKKELKM